MPPAARRWRRCWPGGSEGRFAGRPSAGIGPQPAIPPRRRPGWCEVWGDVVTFAAAALPPGWNAGGVERRRSQPSRHGPDACLPRIGTVAALFRRGARATIRRMMKTQARWWCGLALLATGPANAQRGGPPPPPPIAGGEPGYAVPPVTLLLDLRGEPRDDPPPLAPPPLPEVRSGRRDATPGATVTTTTAATGSRMRAADEGSITTTTDVYADPPPPSRPPRRPVSARRR